MTSLSYIYLSLPVVCNLLQCLIVLPSVSAAIPRQCSASDVDSLKPVRARLIIADLVNIVSLSYVHKQIIL